MSKIFANFDFEGFWDNSDFSIENYVDVFPNDEVVAIIERMLGYKLPASYVEFMRFQNGGTPRRSNHRTTERTTWAEDHVAITGLFSIGTTKRYSLAGPFGSRFFVNEWSYPDIGIYFADCPSAGHDMLCFDYRSCGPFGEPTVVHVDQELDYAIVHVAKSFEDFIRGLEDDSRFENA